MRFLVEQERASDTLLKQLKTKHSINNNGMSKSNTSKPSEELKNMVKQHRKFNEDCDTDDDDCDDIEDKLDEALRLK